MTTDSTRFETIHQHLATTYELWIDALEGQRGQRRQSTSVKAMQYICTTLNEQLTDSKICLDEIKIYWSKDKAWSMFIRNLKRWEYYIINKLEEQRLNDPNKKKLLDMATKNSEHFINAFMDAPLNKKAYIQWGMFCELDQDRDMHADIRKLKNKSKLDHKTYFTINLSEFSSNINLEYLESVIGSDHDFTPSTDEGDVEVLPEYSNGFSMLENSQVMEEVVNSFNPVEETLNIDYEEENRLEEIEFQEDEIRLMEAEDIRYEEEDDQRIFEFTDGTLTRLVNHSNLIDFCKLFPLPPPPILTHTPYYF